MFGAIIRLLRPLDWTKNLFVFPALLFSLPRLLTEERGDLATITALLIPTLGAFAAFCVVSSGFYAVNDVFDVEKDRSHPIKRQRPVASGEVPVGVAGTIGIIMIALGLALGFLVNVGVGAVISAYAVLQVLYNLRLKRVMFVDVSVLAVGFSLRAAAGAVAIDVQVSIWLILCVFFLCLYLAFVKRLCDLASAERAWPGVSDDRITGAMQSPADGEARARWVSPAGYNRDELNWLLGISGTLAVVTFLMYSLSDQTWAEFGVKSAGFAMLTPLVLIAIQRFYSRAATGVSDSPFAVLVNDTAVLCSVFLFAAGVVLILFVPQVEMLLESIFYFTKD